jgi:hypothetical protein
MKPKTLSPLRGTGAPRHSGLMEQEPRARGDESAHDLAGSARRRPSPREELEDLTSAFAPADAESPLTGFSRLRSSEDPRIMDPLDADSPPGVDEIDLLVDELLEREDGLNVLAGIREPDAGEEWVSHLREAVLGADAELDETGSSEEDPTEIEHPEYIDDRALATLTRSAVYVSPIVYFPRDELLRRAPSIERVDDFFIHSREDSAIRVLLLDEWSLDEVNHPWASIHSYLAMSSRRIRSMMVDLINSLTRRAVSYPGLRPLEISVVCSIPERGLSSVEYIDGVLSKIRRADLIIADLGISRESESNADSLFELGLVAASGFLSRNTFIIRQVGEEFSFLSNSEDVLEYSDAESLLDLRPYLREIHDTMLERKGKVLIQRDGFQSNSRALWVQKVYDALVALALKREMLGNDVTRFELFLNQDH